MSSLLTPIDIGAGIEVVYLPSSINVFSPIEELYKIQGSGRQIHFLNLEFELFSFENRSGATFSGSEDVGTLLKKP